MASRLSRGFADASYKFVAETETNQLFPILPNDVIEKLKAKYDFYVWEPYDASSSALRLVTSWATSEKQVDAFISDLNELSA